MLLDLPHADGTGEDLSSSNFNCQTRKQSIDSNM